MRWPWQKKTVSDYDLFTPPTSDRYNVKLYPGQFEVVIKALHDTPVFGAYVVEMKSPTLLHFVDPETRESIIGLQMSDIVYT